MTTSPPRHSWTASPADALDVVIVGAGMTGVYLLWMLRQRGFKSVVVEAGDGVGGTWHWNRYPGARFDSESYSYGYFFSDELWQQWQWKEHFSGQKEIEAYLNFVVDKFDLREHIKFDASVTSATFDDETATWTVATHDGRELSTRILITAIGILSAPQYPNVPGLDTFAGESHHTARWPKGGVDLKGKRVAVIGTGASGVQLIPEIVSDVQSLTVFQRTPNWNTPLRNSAITADEQNELLRTKDVVFDKTQNQTGFIHSAWPKSAYDYTPEQRREIYEQLFATPGLAKLYGNFPEVMRSREINDEFTEFLREKISARVPDPELATMLIPTDHGYGIKRPPMETNYYEAFAHDHVALIDLIANPIASVNAAGIEMNDKTQHDFDVIIYATGFDAVTGAFDKIDITGPSGRTLRDYWSDGPRTYLGMLSHGFPNLFFVGGPQSVAGNFPRSTERQVRFVSDLLEFVRSSGAQRISVTEDAEADWVVHVGEVVEKTLLAADKKHWSFGGNTPGKAIVHRNYAGGMINYAQRCDEVENDSYAGFSFSRETESEGVRRR